MNFYTLNYLENQQEFNQILRYAIIMAILLVLIGVTVLYVKNKLQTKYRDLSIILGLVLLFWIGINVTDYQKGQVSSNQTSQAQIFLNKIAKKHYLKASQVALNSKGLVDGAIVKIKNKYYRLDLSLDQTSYTLERIQLINEKIKLID